MSKMTDKLVALMPNAQPGRLANNVFDFTVVMTEAGAFEAAIDTLAIFGEEAIAYYIYDTFGDERIRITFPSGNAEPLIHFNKLRAAC